MAGDQAISLVPDALTRWRSGGFDGIECSLVQAPDSVVAPLMDAYRVEADPRVRQAIVFTLWQRRSLAIVPFLEVALRDRDRRVWQEGLDGLVALGSPAARAALVAARNVGLAGKQRPWIDEAIEQLDEPHAS